MHTEKDGQTMSAAEQLEVSGKDLIDYLTKVLDYRIDQLAALIDVNERTLRYWAPKALSELPNNSSKLYRLFTVVERMEKENIPASAILKLITGSLIQRQEDSPSIMSAILSDPDNDLIEYAVENLIQQFKSTYYSKTSKQKQSSIRERFRLNEEQRAALLKKVRR